MSYNIFIIGAGPAGLALAIFLKRMNLNWNITIVDKRKENDCIGFGVTVPEDVIDLLEYNGDFKKAKKSYISWEGNRYLCLDSKAICLDRTKLVKWMQCQVEELGVNIIYETNIRSLDDVNLNNYQLVVGADGVNSIVKSFYENFFDLTVVKAKTWHAWLCSANTNPDLVTTFHPHDDHLFVSHSYPYSRKLSTFIVECTDDSWKYKNFEHLSSDETLKLLSDICEVNLMESNNKVKWNRFNTISLKRWFYKNVVVIGDAAHTANYAGGRGTKLAIFDAYFLARALAEEKNIENSLRIFDENRKQSIKVIQRQSQSRHNWHSNILESYNRGDKDFVETSLKEASSVIYN